MKQIDDLDRCRTILTDIFQKLNCVIADNQIKDISQILIETMGGRYRYFHNFDHALMVSQSDDPLIALAGLFHDLVYTQVDRCIGLNICSYLSPFIREKESNLFVKDSIDRYEKELEIVLTIFNIKKGTNLTNFIGKNEFLSALTITIILSPYLSLKVITRLVTILELTIPFRKSNKDELSVLEQLQKRLEKVNEQFCLGIEKNEITLTMIQAVKLANLDVSGFGLDCVEEFVYNTWSLLPETNHGLISLEKSTVREYCLALAQTSKFLNSLSPEIIFHRYQNEPSQETWQQLLTNCDRNLAITKLYIRSIVLSLSLIDALCCRFCDRISFSFLFGFASDVSYNFRSFTSFLPEIKSYLQSESELEKKVLSLIESQPKPDLFMTLQYNELVNYIVGEIGFSKIEKLFPSCCQFLNNEIKNEDLLILFPQNLIETLTTSIELLLVEKRKRLLQ